MKKARKGMTWEEVIQDLGELPAGHSEKPFADRAAEAEAWLEELKEVTTGIPIVRMGRPVQSGPKVVTALVTFRMEQGEKAILEALARAQGRSLSELLRGMTHDLVASFKAGQRATKV